MIFKFPKSSSGFGFSVVLLFSQSYCTGVRQVKAKRESEEVTNFFSGKIRLSQSVVLHCTLLIFPPKFHYFPHYFPPTSKNPNPNLSLAPLFPNWSSFFSHFRISHSASDPLHQFFFFFFIVFFSY